MTTTSGMAPELELGAIKSPPSLRVQHRKADPIDRKEEGACRRLPNGFSERDYFALLFSVSIRSLAAGPDEAGFWPVISWPSATV